MTDIKHSQNLILPSRYEGEYIELIPLNENIYKVDFTNNPYSYRIIYNLDNSIHAFDPSGGPFVSVGDKVTPLHKIVDIQVDDSTKDLLVTVDFIK